MVTRCIDGNERRWGRGRVAHGVSVLLVKLGSLIGCKAIGHDVQTSRTRRAGCKDGFRGKCSAERISEENVGSK
jgi:hypothetical protein